MGWQFFGYRAQEDANNKPTAAQDYQVGGATTGMQTFTSSGVVNGFEGLLLAEEIDANGNPAGAWEICLATYATTPTPDEWESRTLVKSSTGSLIDWSAAGVDATPRLSLINAPTGKRREFNSGTVSGSPSYITPADATNFAFQDGNDYLFQAFGLRTGTDGVYLRYQVHDGTSWVTTGGSPDLYQGIAHAGYGATNSINAPNQTTGVLHAAVTAGNSNTSGAEERITLNCRIFDPRNSSSPWSMHVAGVYYNTSGLPVALHGQYHLSYMLSIQGFRIYPHTGTWDNEGKWLIWEIEH